MTIPIREAKIEDAHAIVATEKEIAKTPGYFCSQPDELSKENVISTITKLRQSKKGIYLVAEHQWEIVGHVFLEALHLKSMYHVAQLSIAYRPSNSSRQASLISGVISKLPSLSRLGIA